MGVRKAVCAAWPKLQTALVAAFGATAVKAAATLTPVGASAKPSATAGSSKGSSSSSSTPPGMATLEGYAALCGAVQMNCVEVKVPNPIVRYIVGTPEAAAAPNPLEPAVRWLADEQTYRAACRVEEEEKVLKAGDNEDDDDDEDEDGEEEDDEDEDENEDTEDGDEVMEFNWGRGLTFDTSLFPAMKGVAVFPLISGLNHSCDPNCEVAYIDDANVLLVAKRPVVGPGQSFLPRHPTRFRPSFLDLHDIS